MRRVAIIGTGHSQFCFNSPKTSVELLSEVAMDAIQEASLTPKDIQAVNVGNVLGDFEEGQGMIQSFFANDIGCFNVAASRFEGACASGSMAVRDAVMWVASGYYDIMLVGGVEKCTAMGTPWPPGLFPCSVTPTMNSRPASCSQRYLPCWPICMPADTVSPWRSSRIRWRRYRSSPMNMP